jgi:hypothetical protein
MEQANAIREAAEREAGEIRRRAAYEAGAAREAERKAGELKRQAAAQAAAMREAAEREADELRAGAIRLAAELGEVAAYVTRTLDMPAIPAPERRAQPRWHVGEDSAIPAAPAQPEAWAAARPRSQAQSGRYYIEDLDSGVMPGAGPETWQAEETWEPEGWAPESPPARPRSRQAARPGLDGRATTHPATRPDPRPTRPATKPAKRTNKPARSRQYRTMRTFAGTITALVLLALATGAYQLATRGYTFFTFRSAGTGATDNNAIFPGIIPTPKPSPAHHHPTTRPGQPGPRRAHHRRHHRRESTAA